MRLPIRVTIRCASLGAVLLAACGPSTPTTTPGTVEGRAVSAALKGQTGTPTTAPIHSPTPTPEGLNRSTPTPAATGTADVGATGTPGASGTATPTPGATSTATPTPTPTPTATPTGTPTPKPTPTPLVTTTLSLHPSVGANTILGDPAAMVSDAAGQIYLADAANNVIYKFDPVSGVTAVYAGTGTLGDTDGAVGAATFSSPTGLALDKTNNVLYVSEANTGLIRKIDLASNTVSTYAGGKANNDLTTVGYTDGPADHQSQFGSPQGLALDLTDAANPILYVADSSNNAIRKVSLVGGVLTVGSVIGTQASHAAHTTTDATPGLHGPTGLLVDPPNHAMFILDSSNNAVRRFDTGTLALTTLAGGGADGYKDDTGAAAQFRLGGRADLAFNSGKSGLYIPDNRNNRIRLLDLASNAVTTVAGQDVPGTANGDPNTAQFNLPTNVLSLGAALYVSDEHGKSIRQLK